MEFILLLPGFIVSTFIYAYLWHMHLFKNLYREIGIYNREKPILFIGLITVFLQAIIFSFLYQHISLNLLDIPKAMILGLILGLFEFCSSSLAFSAKRKIEKFGKWIFIQFMLSTTIFPISGTIAVLVKSIIS